LPNFGVIAFSKSTVAFMFASVSVATTAVRMSALAGRPRSVPRILPASGSLRKKFITSTTMPGWVVLT
jgi:hypothetical protein